MSVGTTNIRDTGTGNGVTTAFPFTFRALDPTHIQVYKGGALQTINTDYTVAFANSDLATGGTGGTITYAVAPGNGVSYEFKRNTPRSQQYDPQYLQALNQDALENAFDKAILICQEIDYVISTLGGGGGGGGSGDVVGPASATARSIALYADTTGKLLKDGVALGSSTQPLFSGGAGADPAFRAIVGSDLASSPSNGEFLGFAGGVMDWLVPSVSANDVSPLFTTSESGLSITFSASTAAQNAILAGPASGGSGAYSFRSMVPLDLASSPSNGEFLGITAGALDWQVPAVTANDLTPLFTTSESGLGITFSPIAKSGNVVLASPSGGGSGNPDFRNLVKADQVSTTVYNDQANTYSTGQQSFASASILLPTGAPTAGQIAYVSNKVRFHNGTSVRDLVDETRSVSAGTGLSGGGDLSANRTISLSAVTTALGGTGRTDATIGTGKVLVGDGTGYALTNLVAGANVTIDDTSTPGTISIAATGGGGGGSGDVVGPASSTNRAIALYANTTGKLLKDGPALGSSTQPLFSGGAGADPAFRAIAGADLAASPANGEFLGIVGGVMDWTVPSVSANDHPNGLFTTSESGLAITFAAVNQSAYNVFGNNSSSSAAPTFVDSGQLTRLLPVAKSANFTAAWGESYPVSTSGGNVTCTIPAATGSGKFIYVSHDVAGNTLTIQRTGSDTLSGLTSFSTTVLDDGFLIHDIKSGKAAVM